MDPLAFLGWSSLFPFWFLDVTSSFHPRSSLRPNQAETDSGGFGAGAAEGRRWPETQAGFVLSVTAESPGQHLSLGQQNLGVHSQGASLEDQNGIVFVFSIE